MPQNALPSFDSFTEAFGVNVTVRRSDGPPISTIGIWLPPEERTDMPGTQMGKVGAMKVMALPTADVDRLPNGTLIDAPPLEGGASRVWQVERTLAAVAHDHRRFSLTLARNEG